jgi:hypothetical protein
MVDRHRRAGGTGSALAAGDPWRRAMSQLTTDLKADMQKSLDELRMMRDLVRVQLHLAGMDAKTRWTVLEEELFQAEKAAESTMGEAAHKAIRKSVAKLEAFRSSLHGSRKSNHQPPTARG